MRSNDFELFKNIIWGVSQVCNLPIDHPFNEGIEDENDKTLLMIACEHKYSDDYLELLLAAGVSASLYNDMLEKYPIHCAAREKNEGALRSLLYYGADINALIYRSGRTALHICAEENFQEGVNTLLEYSEDIDVNIKDNKGEQTPLYISITKRNAGIVTKLLEHGADLSHECFHKSLREHLKIKIPDFDPDSVQVKVPAKKISDHDMNMWKLNTLIEKYAISLDDDEKGEHFEEFVSILSTMDPSNGDIFGPAKTSLLHKACSEALPEFVKVLLEQGFATAEEMTERSEMPLMLAAFRANIKLIKLLIHHGANIQNATRRGTTENMLHFLLGMQLFEDSERKECVMFLLQPPDDIIGKQITKGVKAMINQQDSYGNTALHYAGEFWDADVASKVLELGANIGIINHWNQPAFEHVSSKVLEEFFDDHCLKTNWNERGDKDQRGLLSKHLHQNEDLKIHFDYTPLLPCTKKNNKLDLEEGNSHDCLIISNENEDEDVLRLPESNTLLYLNKSPEHQHLLNHPLISSFIWFKLERLRRTFNLNFRMFSMFVFLLTWHIIKCFGSQNSCQNVSPLDNSISRQSSKNPFI